MCETFKYPELSDSAKEKARDWYREGNLDSYDWYDFVYEDAERIANILGISLEHERKNTPAIYFSGFSSQGDGACFEGSYRYAKGAVKAIMAYAPQDAELLRIAKDLQDEQRRNFYQLRATTNHRGHYYHAYCMTVNVEDVRDNYGNASDEAEETIAKLLRDFANWIYSSLEKEYDYLMSDESVEESILANEYEFDEDGNIA